MTDQYKEPPYEEVDDEEDEMVDEEAVLLKDIPPLSREEFYDRLADLQDVERDCGGLDIDDIENTLMVTILSLDQKIIALMEENARLKANGKP